MTNRARRKSAVVIGGGFGGLALANRLQSAGMDVTLLEKRPLVGGRAYRLQSHGFTWDMGPSLITAPEIIQRVFQMAGRDLSEYVQLEPLDPFYRVYFHDDTFIDYGPDEEALLAQMRRFNPKDAERYHDFMRDVRPIYEAVIEENLGARPFDSIRSMLSVAPTLLWHRAVEPVKYFVDRYFDDFRHQFLFSFHPLFIGGNPFRAPSVYVMIPYLERKQGVWYTQGGMYSLVSGLAKLFTDQGGTLKTGHPVERIVIEDGKATGVQVEGGALFKADVVVSNADVVHTYRELVPRDARRHWSDRRVDNLKQSMSCFLIYAGVKKQFPQLRHHTIILSERYKGLITDIFDRKKLPADFSLYLHAPTRSDDSMAPPGCESLYILAPVANLQSGTDWQTEKEAFAERILGFLEEWGLEGLREHLVVRHLFTPDDFASELNAAHGNAFGIEPRLSQTAFLRPHNASEDVDNLYLVGAGTHPGAGIPGVLLGAEATAYCVARDLNLSHKQDIRTIRESTDV